MIKSKMLKNRFSSSANISFTVVNYLNNLKVKPLKKLVQNRYLCTSVFANTV